MRSYAIDDVRYMLPMIEDFRRQLTAAGRWSWFVQMCAAARSQVLERTGKGADDIWRIAGWGKLDSRGLGFLRALWHWRDDQAHRWDKPPFKVLSNGVMLDFARRLSADESDEIRISSRFPPHVHQRFHEALAAAKAEPEDDLPIRNRRKRVLKSDDWEEVYGRLKDMRDRTAHELDIEASLIAPRNSLEQYAFNAEEREALRAELFLPWQQSFLFPETGASE